YRSYQYHQLAIGLEGADWREHVHGQITTLKSALVHPVVLGLPLDLRSSLGIFRKVHAALGLLNANFSDTRRPDCWLGLDSTRLTPSGAHGLDIHYTPPPGEEARIGAVLR